MRTSVEGHKTSVQKNTSFSIVTVEDYCHSHQISNLLENNNKNKTDGPLYRKQNISLQGK